MARKISRRVQETSAVNVFREGVLVHLKIGRWGARAKMKDEHLPDDFPKEVARAVQDLIEDKTALQEITAIRRECKRYLIHRSLPFPIDGLFFAPKKFIVEIDEYFESKKQEYEERLDEFLGQYGRLKSEYRQKYPDIYRANKYPNEHQLRSKFFFSWSFRQFVVPDQEMELLSPEIYKKEMSKFKEEVDEMKKMTVAVIGNAFVAKINTLARQCENEKINAGTIKGINKLLEKFDTLWGDFVGQKQLRATITEVRKYMKSVSADRLRDNDKFREEIGEKMEKIVGKLEKLPDVKLKRKLDR